jgi:hypothetical protein
MFVLLFLGLGFISYAQDIIYLKSGEKITSFNTTIPLKGDEITCFKSAVKNAEKFTLKKADIYLIDRVKPKKYVWFFNDKGIMRGLAKKDLEKLGINDYTKKSPCLDAIIGVANNYNGTGTFLGTFIPGFLVWPVGLVETIVVASIPPSAEAIKLDQATAMADQAYTKCYKDYAFKTKRRLAWMGWGNGTSLGIAIGMLIFTLASM